jgi:hypothetical protein
MERGRFYQQFGESSGSGKAGKQEAQTSGIVPKEQAWYKQDIPHEQFVTALRHFLEQERAQAAKEGHSFNPFLYLHLKLNDAVNENYQIRESPSAEYLFFEGLRDAWDALSYDHYSEGGNKQMIERCLHHYLEGTHIVWRGNKPFFVLQRRAKGLSHVVK